MHILIKEVDLVTLRARHCLLPEDLLRGVLGASRLPGDLRTTRFYHIMVIITFTTIAIIIVFLVTLAHPGTVHLVHFIATPSIFDVYNSESKLKNVKMYLVGLLSVDKLCNTVSLMRIFYLLLLFTLEKIQLWK